jgi:glucokinase
VTPGPLAIGIDIGGTKVAAGVVNEAGEILALLRRDTPATSPAAVEDTIADLVSDLRADYDIVAIGVGPAGFVDVTRSEVLFSPHLAWRNEPLRAAVEVRTGVPVSIDNDANCAAWAEWRFGAGRGESHFLLVALGTGIGGGIVADGRLYRGRYGMAGEFGHMQVAPDGRPCECGQYGCWEQYASGNVLGRAARGLVDAGAADVGPLLERAGGDPDALTGALVTDLARDGDPCATWLLADVGRWLGVGLAGLAAAFDPAVIVIAGGVSDAGELLIGPAREAFRNRLTGGGFRPEAAVVQAALGSAAGIVGAADLARTDAQSRL